MTAQDLVGIQLKDESGGLDLGSLVPAREQSPRLLFLLWLRDDGRSALLVVLVGGIGRGEERDDGWAKGK